MPITSTASTSAKKAVEEFLQQNREIERVELLYVDVNGVPRGKWAKPESLIKVFSDEFRLPRSGYVLDIWGDSVRGTGLVLETGDQDGICRGVLHSLGRANWLEQPSAVCLLSMYEDDGEPFYADPRHVLGNILHRFDELDLTPVIALELEFYLLDRDLADNGHAKPPHIGRNKERYNETQLLNIMETQDFDALFKDIDQACQQLNIPADTAIKENAPAQFEINLSHQSDALLAADHAFLLKRIIKGCALRHGYYASFMAKPFPELAGNGLHMHASILDNTGNNIFAQSGGDALSKRPTKRYADAIAGLLELSPEYIALFAPHYNSYRRLVDGVTLAPTTLSWGYENRTALVRLPLAKDVGRRVEYRLPSSDANPYLVAAAILSGLHHGITTQPALPDETQGDAYSQHEHSLAVTWHESVVRWKESSLVEHYFGKQFQHAYTMIKEKELKRFNTTITDFEYHSYLRHS